MVRLTNLLVSVTSLLALGALAAPDRSCKDDVCSYAKPDKCFKPYNCGKFCTDKKTDPKNCGTCGKQCGYGESCVGGYCKKPTPPPTCAYGETKCPKKSAPGGYVCRNTKNDLNNCGKCGKVCGYGEKCLDGYCKKPTPPKPTCPYGQTVCPKKSDPKGYVCRDLKNDSNNCNKCGYVCPYGGKCVGGTCKAPEPTCPYGKNVCPKKSDPKGYVCRDFQTDNNNCGKCANVCTYGKTCVGGECKAPTCPANEEYCSYIDYPGCKSLKDDNDNCGTCGNKCDSSKGQTCQGGVCKDKEPTCTPGQACKNPVDIPLTLLRTGTTPVNECCEPGEQCNANKSGIGGTCGPPPDEEGPDCKQLDTPCDLLNMDPEQCCDFLTGATCQVDVESSTGASCKREPETCVGKAVDDACSPLDTNDTDKCCESECKANLEFDATNPDLGVPEFTCQVPIITPPGGL